MSQRRFLDYLQGAGSEYVDELYEQYLRNPDSIDESWRYFFDGLGIGTALPRTKEKNAKATNGKTTNGVHATNGHTNGHAQAAGAATSLDLSSEAKVADLINTYRARGHLLANVDPLNLSKIDDTFVDLKNFALSASDLERTFTAGNFLGMGPAKLKDILARLRETYCSSIGAQFMQIEIPEEREWLRQSMEASRNREDLSADLRKKVLKRLTESEGFERFLHTRYVAQKRFSIEGGESLIPALDRLIEVAADLGAIQVVMGMAHRGRLNVLTNIYGKKPEYIFTEFEQEYAMDKSMGEGDVKYHMGYSADVVTSSGKAVHLSLANNPSHLEFVSPVVAGVARAKQRFFQDKERNKVIPISIHGDAAFAGQGVVYETLNLSLVKGWWVGGTIHLVINNQVGFTTSPSAARSTPYCTDLGRMLQAPIFHVNGDDVEAVYYVSRLAMEYRQKFKKDVIIDLVCYRKYGHNEGDEPSFTQPLLYKAIKDHPSTREVYFKRLHSEGIVTDAESQAMLDEVMDRLTASQKITRAEKPKPFVLAYQNVWANVVRNGVQEESERVVTAVPEATIKEISKKLNTIPQSFKLNSKLGRFFEARQKAIDAGAGIDWGNAETLAYATLIMDKHPVRLTGQDVGRGTFTHRHAVLCDGENGEEYVPLQHLAPTQQENFTIYNSILSETGVLGFEYGVSLVDPKALVLWEAQFGDFANGAQVIIDQFICSGEQKWSRSSGLVMLLPHGYEGQGPEHSSARLERFLQMCAKENIIVGNFTTPAQFFHALRRQVKWACRKPLIVMTPKSLLRHPMAVSKMEDFTKGRFLEVLDDVNLIKDDAAAKKVRRVVLCSGKIYYDLRAVRDEKKIDDVALVRLEQFYPWPEKMLTEILARYPKAELAWAQEEPRNMGGWSFVAGQWSGVLSDFGQHVGKRQLRYLGREVCAAPAVGSARKHQVEQMEIIQAALE